MLVLCGVVPRLVAKLRQDIDGYVSMSAAAAEMYRERLMLHQLTL